VSESFSLWIKTFKDPIEGPNPKKMGGIKKEFPERIAGDAVCVVHTLFECPETISIKPAKAIACGYPEKAATIHNAIEHSVLSLVRPGRDTLYPDLLNLPKRFE
jgi:hypothetical protein